VGASIGAHPAPAGTPLTHALTLADAAMYTAKTRGGGWELLDTTLDPHAPRRWKRTRPAPRNTP
jgi:GGDEF domain-containing protein